MRARRTFHPDQSEGRRRGKRRRGRNAAMLSVVADDAAQAELRLDLDELFREGARRMLAVALEAEVDAYIAGYAAQVDGRGPRLVGRNGHAPARTIAASVGRVEVARPRVDDRRVDPATGQRAQFHSQILPRWCRRSPKVAAVLPLLYLHGLSSSDPAGPQPATGAGRTGPTGSLRAARSGREVLPQLRRCVPPGRCQGDGDARAGAQGERVRGALGADGPRRVPGLAAGRWPWPLAARPSGLRPALQPPPSPP